MSRAAAAQSLAAICVAQFEASENKAAKLGELIAIESWKRSKFVSKESWATMPGSDASESRVADECAVKLATRKS